MNFQTTKYILPTLAAFSLTACMGTGSGSGGHGADPAESNFAYEDTIKKEDVLLRAGGNCGKNRYYRVLETELIQRNDGLMSVGQLILEDDGTYTLANEIFAITQKGPELYNYTQKSPQVVRGRWTINGDTLKIEQGTIRKLNELVTDREDAYYQYTDASDPKAEKIIFKPVDKISERFIPTKYGCSNQAELLPQGQSGKFAIDKKEVLGVGHVFRNTTHIADLNYIVDNVFGTNDEENFFCRIYGRDVEDCGVALYLDNSKSGTLRLFKYLTVRAKDFNFSMKYDDNHFQLQFSDGRIVNMAPSALSADFYIEDTEESIGDK